jgi:hypothetical protein
MAMSRRISPALSGTPIGRRTCLAALGAMALGGFGTTARGEDAPAFRVIVHPDNPVKAVDRAVLAKIFLKETTTWEDGEAAHPVDLRGDSDTRTRFSEAVIKRPISAVRSYWQQKIFSGRGVPPPEVESDADVVRYVLRYRGSVGYVSAHADVGKSKVISVNY